MQCIYFTEPGRFMTKATCGIGAPYYMEEDILNKYCKTDNFRNCPRYRAYLETKGPR